MLWERGFLCWEVVLFLEGPLLEVPLYYTSKCIIKLFYRFGGNMISRLAASSSMTINETGRGHLLRPNQNGSPDMEASFNKLKETTRSASLLG